MFYKKVGFPEENELVFGTVTNIQHNSVFVEIEEYGKSGLIHISEISSGRIRDINDYVKEGERIVAKVIKIHEDKGHIDLSMRRVTKMQKKARVNERKQEQKAEKLLADFADTVDEYPQKIYQEIKPKIKYELLHEAFQAVIEDDESLKDIGVPEKYAEDLEKLVRETITRKTVKVGGNISIETYDSNGINVVKNSLKNAENTAENITITYLGAGKYKIVVEDYNYKDAEDTLSKALNKIKDPIQQTTGGEYTFEKQEQKD